MGIPEHWSKVVSMNGRDWVPRDEAERRVQRLAREARDFAAAYARERGESSHYMGPEGGYR